MRKISLVILAMLMSLSSCRKSPDYVPYIGETSMLAYTNYAEQFDMLWNNINTGYVFWDVDETDWDEVYEDYMPQFEALDLRVQSGKGVSTKELKELYEGAMGGLIDHHMSIMVKNLHPQVSNNSVGGDIVNINPASKEISTRDYYYKNSSSLLSELSEFNKKVAEKSYSEYKISYSGYEKVKMEDETVTVCYILFELPGGKLVPYLWQSAYKMTPIMSDLNKPYSSYYKAAQLIDKWQNAAIKTPRERLAGVILDNRCNNGGYLADLNHVIAPFIKKDYSVMSTRYKEGPGRLEHSVWSPIIIEPSTSNRDLGAENIPYVVLSNIYSISMGELTTYHVSQLPTGYVIGERTYGATGPLLSDAINLTYGGPYGDINKEKHYVYTSTYEVGTKDGFVPEGVGFTPNKEVLAKNVGVKGQLDAALEYIKSYK